MNVFFVVKGSLGFLFPDLSKAVTIKPKYYQLMIRMNTFCSEHNLRKLCSAPTFTLKCLHWAKPLLDRLYTKIKITFQDLRTQFTSRKDDFRSY